jgi:flagellar motor switch protein FliM
MVTKVIDAVKSGLFTQEEVDQLLDAINSGDTEPLSFKPHEDSRIIKIPDYKHLDKFSKEHKNAIEYICKKLVQSWVKLISKLLNIDIYIKELSVESLFYYVFYRSVPNPTTLLVLQGIFNSLSLPFFLFF